MIEKIHSLKKIKTLTSVILLLILGCFIGSHLGNYLISRLLRGDNSIFFYLYQPAYEYINTLSLLESNNDLNRLTGLYSLLECKKIDVDFLIDRYKTEDLIYIKRSIIFLLGYPKKQKKILIFLSEIYHDSPWRIKLEILRTFKRIDINSYNEFLFNNKIDENQFKGI